MSHGTFLQTHHIVPGWLDRIWSDTTALDGDIVSLKCYEQVGVLIQISAIASVPDTDLSFYACTDVAGSNATAIATITYRKMATTDTWTQPVTVTDSKLDIVAGGDIVPGTDELVFVEFNGAEINNASTTVKNLDCFFVRLSGGGLDAGSTIACSATYFLWPCRYNTLSMPTAITD